MNNADRKFLNRFRVRRQALCKQIAILLRKLEDAEDDLANLEERAMPRMQGILETHGPGIYSGVELSWQKHVIVRSLPKALAWARKKAPNLVVEATLDGQRFEDIVDILPKRLFASLRRPRVSTR